MNSKIFKKLKDKFFGKKILIAGLGIAGGGAGAVNFLHKLGAKITVTDLKARKALEDSLLKIPQNTKLILGKHRLEDFLNADYIIKNPAMPWSSFYLAEAKKKNIPILTDARIFFDFAPREKIIGITGSKGKTRTAYLIKHFLKGRYKVLLTGAPGTSVLSDLLKAGGYDWIIWELSSFDLENIKKSPRIAIITNIFQEHLNRYSSFADYKNTKKNIIKYQIKNDISILPDKSIFKKWAKEIDSKVFYFQEKNIHSLTSETSFFAAKKTAQVFKIPEKEILKKFKNSKALEHRLEIARKYKNIVFINDSASTNPDATIFAIGKISKFFKIPFFKIILICGGLDKKLDYKELSRRFPELKKVILLPGSASDKIKEETQNKNKNLIEINSLDKAVKESVFWAEKGDVILFSPGATSFNLFRNEFDRGDKFKKLVKNLK